MYESYIFDARRAFGTQNVSNWENMSYLDPILTFFGSFCIFKDKFSVCFILLCHFWSISVISKALLSF